MVHPSRYDILDKLGEGAMGEVFRARDRMLGRVVALKMLGEESQSDDHHKRFVREAEAIGRLDHPNIVKVYDLGEVEGKPYMAMELLEGEDLRALIERHMDVPISERVRVLEEVALGIAYAHSKGVIHRDLKPANVMVNLGGQVKILDFGLARVAAQGTITRKGVILGTPDYMCPEQAQGRPVDPRSDIFCAGSVFYEALTFQKPFLGKTLHSVLYQIISEQPIPVLTLNPEIPARLAAVVHRMLQKDPDRRYPQMGDVAEELRDIRRALRRSRGRSAAAPWVTPTEEARSRMREHLGKGRALAEGARPLSALGELQQALSYDPDAVEPAELLWRTWRRLKGAHEPDAPDPALAGRIAALLQRAAPGAPEGEARKALAELALLAPDDPRFAELVRSRAERKG
jgi:serine/threonine protein kinase